MAPTPSTRALAVGLLAVAGLLNSCSAGDGAATAGAASTSAPRAAGAVDGGPAPVSVAPDEPDPGEVATDPAPSTSVSREDEESSAVDVVTVFADLTSDGTAVEAGGYVVGLVESGGTCTLSLSKGGRERTASVDALPDASVTNCGGLTVPTDQLGSGTWRAVLRYRSDAAAGSAAAVDVVVP